MVAHAVGMTQKDTDYQIIPKNPAENRAIAVFYGPEYLKQKEDKRAEIAMREPKYNSLFQYGYLHIRIQSWEAGTSNPKNWLFIVLDGNRNEIYRDYGDNSRPNYSKPTWWSTHIIYLTDNVVFPLYLRVINIHDEAFDITIKKK
jgi:hypothetical protein